MTYNLEFNDFKTILLCVCCHTYLDILDSE